jgi:hypothetical protein
MDSETQGQATSRKYTKRGVNTLKDAYSQFLEDPLFMRQRGIVQNRLDQPFTFDASTVAGMKAGANEQAQGAYQGALGQSLERAGAAGGYRGGAQRGSERRLAQGLGSTVANLNREIDTQAALQKGVDVQNASTLGSGLLTSQYQFPRDIANIWAGAATNPTLLQPSPFAQLMSGVGQTASSLITNPPSFMGFGGGGGGGGGGMLGT